MQHLKERILKSLYNEMPADKFGLSISSLALKIIFTKHSISMPKTIARIIASHLGCVSFNLVYSLIMTDKELIYKIMDYVNSKRDEVLSFVNLEALLGFANTTNQDGNTRFGKVEAKFANRLLSMAISDKQDNFSFVSDDFLPELKENNSTKFKIIEDDQFIQIYRGFTEKQRTVYEYILSDDNNFFIATHGAVRVGKTYSTSLAILKLIEDHINNGKEGSIILMGKSLTSLHRNILEPMSKWKLNIDIPVSSKSTIWKITDTFSVHLSGYGTTACEAIRGITASLIYIDEISNVTEDNFNSILLTRASLPYSKIISTSNPISSHHWYAQMFKKLESGEFNENRTRYSQGFRFNLLTDKNSAISDDYITGLTQAYGIDSAIYKRNVLGLDVNQESSIFNIDEEEISKVINLDEKLVSEVVIGHDKGFSSPMVYVSVFAYKEKATDVNLKFHIDSILYYQKGHGSYIKPSQYKIDLDNFLLEKRKYNPIIVFPHDAGADINVIKERNNVICKPNYKKSSVLNGIEYMRELFNKGILTIDPSCKELIYELFSYKFDEKALEEKNTEKVLKEDDHSVDALRYALVSMKAFHKSKDKGTYEF